MMMLKNALLASLLMCALNVYTQTEYVLLSYGGLYNSQTFYTLSNDQKVSVFNDDWHIMLTATGIQDAGILVNESVTYNGNALELYLAPSDDFSEVIDPADLTLPLFNPDSSWNVGAFNSLRNPNNPGDFGWGLYDPAKMSVVGNEVFVLKLRNGGYKKMKIEALALTTYQLRWANLDGTDEKYLEVDKRDFPNSDLILLDILDEETLPSPEDFDLYFTRYIEPLDDGNGGVINYVVTGVLSAPGVEVVQIDDVDPQTVVWSDYEEDFDERLDIIGQDWKSFDLPTLTWQMAENRSYLVKDRKGVVWQVIFQDFEGSSTGNVVFTKEKVGSVEVIDEIESLQSWLVFPNPVADQLQILIQADLAQEVQFQIFDLKGGLVKAWSQSLSQGLVSVRSDVDHLQSGQYLLVLSANEGSVSQSFVKQ